MASSLDESLLVGTPSWGAKAVKQPWYVLHAPKLAVVALLAVAGAIAAAAVAVTSDEGGSGSGAGSGPSPNIQQIILAAADNGADSSHALQVSWVVPYGATFAGTPPLPSLSPAPPVVNSGVVPSSPRVRWGSSPTDLRFSSPAGVRTYTYTTPATDTSPGSNYTSPLLLNATIGCTGVSGGGVRGCEGSLVPGQPLFYQVGDDANGWSNVFATATLPAPGAAARTRWAIIGDLGTTNNSADTIAHILESHDADAFAGTIIVGDLSYADGTSGVWDYWGSLVQPLTSVLPLATLPGNHEAEYLIGGNKALTSFTPYVTRLRAPSARANSGFDPSSLYYSFDSGLVHFVMLQGYCPGSGKNYAVTCLQAGSAQRAWLEADLAAVDRAKTPWIVAAFHQPYMNSNTAHAIAVEGLPMQAVVEDILYGAKVDLVLSGHVHAYERNCRAYNFTCVPDGPYYITIGDGGNREGLASSWVQPQPAWSVVRRASYGHGELTVTNATHMLWQWHQNPDLAPVIADSLWIVKGVQGEVGPGVTHEPALSEVGKARGASLKRAEPEQEAHA